MSAMEQQYQKAKSADYQGLRDLVRSQGKYEFSPTFAYIGAIRAGDWDTARRVCDAARDILRGRGKTGRTKEFAEWNTRWDTANMAGW